MTDAEWLTKKRPLIGTGAWRLMREDVCADYARCAVSSWIRGTRIEFPQTVVTRGLYVSVRTRRIAGETKFSMLSQPDGYEDAVEMGLIILEALYTAEVASGDFRVFSILYKYGKGPAVALRMLLGSPRLSRDEKRELIRLMKCYLRTADSNRVLAHGDLHTSHIIVNRPGSTLGLVDLEAVHIGKPATNFAQLWIGYHYADRALGVLFYDRHMTRFPNLATDQFDTDVRVETALRAHRQIREAERIRNTELRTKAEILLHGVLQAFSFEEACHQGRL